MVSKKPKGKSYKLSRMGKNEERKNEQCGVHEKSIDSFAGCFVYTNVE